MALGNPEGRTEVLPVLLAMYPFVHDVYKYWSHSLEATEPNIRSVRIPEYVSAAEGRCQNYLGQIIVLRCVIDYRVLVGRRERDHWGDLGVDGWIILGWISRRWDVGMWTGLGWHRIGTVGGRL